MKSSQPITVDRTRSKPLLEVKNLTKHFDLGQRGWRGTRNTVRAVDGISFTLQRGETLGIVGESGSGKSTAGRAVLRLIEPTGGEIYFEGRNIDKLSGEAMRQLRRRMQFIYQDPYAALNPRMTVGSIVEEGLVVHGIGTPTERQDRVTEMLRRVGLSAEHASLYPHEFSGGQRQRICIARALVLNPDLIVGDEPVSALDVSIQAQVINLLQDLQAEFGLAYIIIGHNLSVIKHISDRVAVMYLGKFMELANSKELYSAPLHPYTEALLAAVPVPDPRARKRRIILSGDIPSAQNPPQGCPFHTRCPYSQDMCKTVAPEWQELRPGHFVACHYPLNASTQV